MPSPPSRARWLHPRVLLGAATMAVLAAFIYFPAARGPFVWDDWAELPQNAVLRDPQGLPKIWSGSVGPDYFPVKTTVEWILWRNGATPAAFHLLGVALHLLCALLLWRLLSALSLRCAWFGAVLFLVHPLAVESVAWIAELKNTLSLAFLLGAMIAYAAFDRQRAAGEGTNREDSAKPYVVSLLLFALALLSKSSVVMFPWILLLHAWWRRGGVRRGDVRAAAPFFGLSLLLGLVTVLLQYRRALGQWPVPVHGLAEHLAVAGPATAFYLGKALLPAALHPIYRPWVVAPPALPLFLPWFGWALVLGWLWMKRATWGRPVLFGLGVFLLNLLPVLGFLPMAYMHYSWVADHFAYLPLLGLVGLAAAAAGALWARAASSAPGRAGLLGAAGLLVLGLAAASRADAGYYRSEEGYWRHVLARNPEAWMAHVDLGRERFEAGQYEQAVAEQSAALALRADLAEAYYNRGSAYLRLDRLAPAIADFEAVLRLQPRSPDALTNLGNALARSGRLGEAVERYEAALRIQPDARDARANLVLVLLQSVRPLVQSGRADEAHAAAAAAVRLDPASAAGRVALGNLLFLQGRLPEAIAQYEAALRLDPGDAGTRSNLQLAQRRLRQAAP